MLPCYNPAPGWCELLQSCFAELQQKLQPDVVDFIIFNDGSTTLDSDEIKTLSTLPNVIVLNGHANEGKGAAIRNGVSRAEGEIIIYTDIDFPFGIDPIVEIVGIFDKSPLCQFIYGHRSHDYLKKLPFKRLLLSKGLRWMNRILLNKDITDTQAGIKGLRRQILPEIQYVTTNTFVFEVELIRRLIQKGICIEKVNVHVRPTILVTDFSLKVVFREIVNFLLITIMSRI